MRGLYQHCFEAHPRCCRSGIPFPHAFLETGDAERAIAAPWGLEGKRLTRRATLAAANVQETSRALEEMDYEKEIEALAGESIALQSLLVALLSRLALSGLEIRSVIEASFDGAADFLGDPNTEAGQSVPPEQLAHSLRIIEDLRAATLGPQGGK